MSRFCRYMGFAALAAFSVVSNPLQSQAPTRPLPQAMWHSTDAYLRAYLGDSIFVTSVRARPDLTLYRSDVVWSCRRLTPSDYCTWPWFTPFYVAFYELDPMSDPLRTGLMAVPIDTAGQIIRAFAPAGIPSCRYRPEQCVFSVTGDSAIEIARREIPIGSEVVWKASFLWLEPPFLLGCRVCRGRFVEHLEVKAAYGWEVHGIAKDDHDYWVYVDATTGTALLALESGMGGW